MGNYVGYIVFIFLVVSCSGSKGDFKLDSAENVYNALDSKDSVDMWCCQYINYYDFNTKKWVMSESYYCKSFFTFKDSIYDFDYPCEFLGSTEIYFEGQNVILNDSKSRKVYKDHDSLYLEYIDNYHNLDSTKFLITESYIKKKYSKNRILEIMQAPKNDSCLYGESWNLECAKEWNHHLSDTIPNFYKNSP